MKLGQPLAHGKDLAQVVATSPGAGVVEKMVRGERRFLDTISIRLDGDDEETFNAYGADGLADLNREQVLDNLLASGLWLSLRTRPYTMTANPAEEPHALFVTAMDTRPLAPDPKVVIDEAREDFASGLTVVSKLLSGTLYVCTAPGAGVPSGDSRTVTVADEITIGRPRGCEPSSRDAKGGAAA